MSNHPRLFSPVSLGKIELKNRITMAPLFLGMATLQGEVSDVMLDHYREMGASGASMIVVESVGVDFMGLGSPNMVRAWSEEYLPGLTKLADAVKANGAKAILQLNHTGRYAYHSEKWGPSTIKFDYALVKEMPLGVIDETIEAYAKTALVAKKAGFDGVEIHGGTAYLPVQFLSPHHNKRTDEYGGSLENRMRFPLRLVRRVQNKVGGDYPVGYRFQADEWLPDGIKLDESKAFASELAKLNVDYLSVMIGAYESFFLEDYIAAEHKEGYQVRHAAEIKKAVGSTAVIAAGRIQRPDYAESVIESGAADAIGLARVLLADPLWPKKASGEIADPISACEPGCQFCTKRVMKTKTSYCIRWPQARREAFQKRIGDRIR